MTSRKKRKTKKRKQPAAKTEIKPRGLRDADLLVARIRWEREVVGRTSLQEDEAW
jgi:hypothetical protein